MANLSKDRLIFDPTDEASSDNMGAYVRAGSDGDLISSTNVGGKEGLDVNFINASIAVTATDLDIRDLAFATDKVDASGSEVSLDAATLAALENITVSATDLDIRNLAFATDKVDASGSEVSLDAATLAALENITVSATDLDIRDLAFATDKVDVTGSEVSLDAATLAALESVSISSTVADDAVDSENPIKVGTRAVGTALPAISASGDRADAISDMYRRIFINDSPNIGLNSRVLTVGATEIAFPTAIAGRRRMMVQNTSSNDIYVGPTGVSTTTGLRVSKGATLSLEIGQNVNMFAIAAGAGNDVRVFELA